MNKYTFTLRAQEMSTNRLIPYGFVDATAVNIETGLTENNAATQLSDFLPVTPGESYVIMQVLNARYESATIGCYDINQILGGHAGDKTQCRTEHSNYGIKYNGPFISAAVRKDPSPVLQDLRKGAFTNGIQ